MVFCMTSGSITGDVKPRLNNLSLIKMNTTESKNLKRKRSDKFEFDPKQKKLSFSGEFLHDL